MKLVLTLLELLFRPPKFKCVRMITLSLFLSTFIPWWFGENSEFSVLETQIFVASFKFKALGKTWKKCWSKWCIFTNLIFNPIFYLLYFLRSTTRKHLMISIQSRIDWFLVNNQNFWKFDMNFSTICDFFQTSKSYKFHNFSQKLWNYWKGKGWNFSILINTSFFLYIKLNQ